MTHSLSLKVCVSVCVGGGEGWGVFSTFFKRIRKEGRLARVDVYLLLLSVSHSSSPSLRTHFNMRETVSFHIERSFKH